MLQMELSLSENVGIGTTNMCVKSYRKKQNGDINSITLMNVTYTV